MEVLGKRRRAAEARGQTASEAKAAHTAASATEEAVTSPLASGADEDGALAEHSSFLLTRTALCVSLQPDGASAGSAFSASAEPGGWGGDPGAEPWSSLAAAARSVSWPQRELRWAPGSPALLPSPPRLVLRCSLLALDGGDDPAAEAILARRLRAAAAAARLPAAPRVLLATRAPVPLLQAHPSPPLRLTDASLPPLLRAVHSFGLAVAPPSAALGPPPALLAALRAHAAGRTAAVEAAARADGLVPFRDDFAYAEASSRSRGRIEIRLRLALEATPAASAGAGAGAAAQPPAALLGELALRSPLGAAARALLCDPFPFVTASVIVSRPGAAAQRWHSDGPHLAPSPGAAAAAEAAARADPAAAEWGAPAAFDPPHAVCVFVPLIDVTEAIGGTEYWLGSHARPGMVEVAEAAMDALSPAAALHVCGEPAGAVVFYDYRTVHRGMPNRSEAGERPLLQFVFRRAGSVWEEGLNFGEGRLMSGGAADDKGAWALRAVGPGAAAAAEGGPGETPLSAEDAAKAEADAAAGAAWWTAALGRPVTVVAAVGSGAGGGEDNKQQGQVAACLAAAHAEEGATQLAAATAAAIGGTPAAAAAGAAPAPPAPAADAWSLFD